MIDPETGLEIVRIQSVTNVGFGNRATALTSSNEFGADTIIEAVFNDTKAANVQCNADAEKSYNNYNADLHKFSTIRVFSGNSAAKAGGLTAGMIYRTGDTLKIVH